MDDRDLVERIAAGDPAAEEAFVTRYGPRLARAVAEFSVPVADRPDVVQEILLDALRQLRAGRFQGRASLVTWLQRIVKGKAVDFHRRTSSRLQRSAVELDERGLELLPTQQLDPDQELSVLLEEVLAAMPPRLEAVFRARVQHQQPFADIARALGVSEGYVRALAGQAAQLVRQQVRRDRQVTASARLKEKEE